MAFLARPQRWLWAIHRHRATITTAPNFGYELCLRRIADADIEGLDLGSLRIAGNGAEAVSPETLARFAERFAPYGLHREALMPLYGLAENAVAVTMPPLDRGPLIDRIQRERFQRTGRAAPAAPDDEHALAVVACGRPIPGHEIRIVDAAGRELPDRREGRLQFRGPSATSGYFRRPEQTRTLFADGWLESGDLAYTADGDVYVTGRSKDLIIRAGRNIYPAELEDAVGELDGVRKGNVAVFASRDPAAPDAPEQLVVLAETRARTTETQDRLRTAIVGLTTDLVGVAPDDVVLAPPGTVLKTSSGKLRRAATRELYEQGRVGRPRRGVGWQLTRLALTGLGPALRRWLYAAGGLIRAISMAHRVRAGER
jgi:acyl-CoA synthetase (AMP-forming)/AMP-acid ligase II